MSNPDYNAASLNTTSALVDCYDDGHKAGINEACDRMIIETVHEIYRASKELTTSSLLVIQELVNILNSISKIKERDDE